jgi:hypothetical protein
MVEKGCSMTQYNFGWQLEITANGQIFVSHFGRPRFKVELIPKNENSEVGFSFDGEWEDHPDDAMHWYMKALEFYQFAVTQPELQGIDFTSKALQNRPADAKDIFYPPPGLNPSQACDSSSPSI